VIQWDADLTTLDQLKIDGSNSGGSGSERAIVEVAVSVVVAA
jgi:hypothetical protein